MVAETLPIYFALHQGQQDQHAQKLIDQALNALSNNDFRAEKFARDAYLSTALLSGEYPDYLYLPGVSELQSQAALTLFSVLKKSNMLDTHEKNSGEIIRASIDRGGQIVQSADKEKLASAISERLFMAEVCSHAVSEALRNDDLKAARLITSTGFIALHQVESMKIHADMHRLIEIDLYRGLGEYFSLLQKSENFSIPNTHWTFDEGLKVAQSFAQPEALAQVYESGVRAFLRIGDYGKANAWLQKAKDIVEQNNLVIHQSILVDLQNDLKKIGHE